MRKRWQDQVITAQGIDRRFYEFCVLTELKNALRSGELWVQGSRQFKDFDEYLLPAAQVAALQALPLAITPEGEAFLRERVALLGRELQTVNRLAAAEALPEATLNDRGQRITPLDNAVPVEVHGLMRQVVALLPHLKITDLLLEVDDWTGVTFYTHIADQYAPYHRASSCAGASRSASTRARSRTRWRGRCSSTG